MLKLAWRNLWRQRGRTLITASTVALSLAMLLISFGVADASYSSMKRSAQKAAGGSVLVHAAGYWQERTPELVLEDAAQLQNELRSLSGVQAVISRVLVQTLISSPRANLGVQLIGVDPKDQARLQDMSRYIVAGSFLATGRAPIVLGKKLAADLGVELGDRVVVTFTGPDGEMRRGLFHLRGILDVGSDLMNAAMAYTTRSALQRVAGMEGQVTQLGLLLDNDARRYDVAAAVKAIRASEKLEALTWDEAMPELVRLIETDQGFSFIFGFVIFLVVGFGVANTLLMSVLERVRELGLLSALGLTPGRVARLVLLETALLLLVAMGIGLTIAFGVHLYLHGVGIDLASMSDLDVEAGGIVMEDMRITSLINLAKWAGGMLALATIILVSALYPALRASRLLPAEAMRSYE